MKDSKLAAMLKTFSGSEMKEFNTFLRSPYFSNGRDLTEYFNCLKPFYPGFDQPKLTPEYLYKKLYPGKKFDHKISTGVLYTLSAELYKLCKKFLIQSGINEDRQRRKFYLLNKLREKKLYKEFEKEYNNQELENDTKGGANDFLNKYFLTHCYLEYCVESRKPSEYFETMNNLGNYSALAALQYGYRNPDLRDIAKLYGVEAKYNFIDNLIENLDSEKLLEIMKINNDKLYPYAAVNYGIFRISKNVSDDELYFSVKKLIIENLSLFGKSEQYVLFSILCSYCVQRTRREYSEMFDREEFELHKLSVELNIYKYNEKDKINIAKYSNIIRKAYFANEIDWLRNFADKYLCELDTIHIECMKLYSDAYFYLGKHNFGKALESLSKINYDFILFKTEYKHLMIKIYYELDYIDQAYSMIDTMKHYLSRSNDLHEDIKQQEIIFLKYATLLLKLKNSNDKKESEQLENKLMKETNLHSKKWFLEKVSELKK